MIRYGQAAAPELSARVQHHAALLRSAHLPGLIEVVPGYVSLVVHFDPQRTSFAQLRDSIPSLFVLAPPMPMAQAGRIITIPVRYDGIDLAEVAERCGLTSDEVIGRHASREYRVALLGFVPGFAYLESLDPALVLPRRSSPRQRVPKGSVAIAGAQTGVYPAETPGGWLIIGTTSAPLFDPAGHPPTLLTVGDRVRFEATTE